MRRPRRRAGARSIHARAPSSRSRRRRRSRPRRGRPDPRPAEGRARRWPAAPAWPATPLRLASARAHAPRTSWPWRSRRSECRGAHAAASTGAASPGSETRERRRVTAKATTPSSRVAVTNRSAKQVPVPALDVVDAGPRPGDVDHHRRPVDHRGDVDRDAEAPQREAPLTGRLRPGPSRAACGRAAAG